MSKTIAKDTFTHITALILQIHLHFLLGYKRLNRMQRRTKREAVRYSRTVLFTVLCIIIAYLTSYALMEITEVSAALNFETFYWYCIVIIGAES